MSVISLAEHKRCCCSPTAKKAESVIHLPVAPQVVARTRFSPPPAGRDQTLMVPEAMEYLRRHIVDKSEDLPLVAIGSPGDPLATPDITIQVIQSIRKTYPKIQIGLKTLGIGSGRLAGELARAGLNYVEMQVDGVRAEVLEKIYAWIRPGSKTLKISDAVPQLLEEQRNGIPALKFHDITVSILTTLYPGYNIDHVPKIGVEMMELGTASISLIPYSPRPGVEVDLESPSPETIEAITAKVSKHLPVTEPLLVMPQDTDAPENNTSALPGAGLHPGPSKERPNVAVVSSNGMEVDLHLGQASRFVIYGPRGEDDLACLLETRDAPKAGSGAGRWNQVAETLNDCFILLAASAGETPRRLLAEKGIRVTVAEDNIEGIVDVLYGGGKKCKKARVSN